MQPTPGAAGNFSNGFAAHAFALVPVGGGQEIVLETGSSTTDDMYSDEFNSIIGDTMVYTLVLRHRDCDPQGWAKCACHAASRATPSLPYQEWRGRGREGERERESAL